MGDIVCYDSLCKGFCIIVLSVFLSIYASVLRLVCAKFNGALSRGCVIASKSSVLRHSPCSNTISSLVQPLLFLLSSLLISFNYILITSCSNCFCDVIDGASRMALVSRADGGRTSRTLQREMQFVHGPLDLNSKTIQVLKVLPGPSKATIECTLHAKPLKLDENMQDYVCLSYR